MSTNFEKRPEYTVGGRVVDRTTRAGIRGVRVEAWDRDTRYHDLLGQAVTNADGQFAIGFDSAYFGDYAPDRAPDLFFKLFLDGREVLSTFDRPIRNAGRSQGEITLELDMPQLQPEASDRVSAQQALKALDWWRASDFRGAWREGKDKAGTIGKLVGGLAGRAVGDFEFKPVRPQGTREREVVDQGLGNAQRALALQQVEVVEVRQVAAGGAGQELRALKDYPLRLNPGDRVVLHEQDGVVKYYTRVPAVKPGAVDGAAVARIDGDVQALKAQVRGIDAIRTDMENLKAIDAAVEQRLGEESGGRREQAGEIERLHVELDQLRKAATAKDVEIAKLRSDLVAVRTAQDNLATRLPLERLAALEQRIERLALPAGPVVGPVVGPVRGGRTVAKKAAAVKVVKKATTGSQAMGRKAPAGKTAKPGVPGKAAGTATKKAAPAAGATRKKPAKKVRGRNGGGSGPRA